jgi:hypothetical protein
MIQIDRAAIAVDAVAERPDGNSRQISGILAVDNDPGGM